LSFHSYSLHLIGSILTFSFSYSHTASLFLIDVVNSTLLFSFSCCYISLDRHNFPSAAHFLLPCSIIHISHHMHCLISFLPISACFHRSMSIFCPFYAVMILASLFSDKLASSLQTRRRPVRILPLSPIYLYAFMPPSRLNSFLRRCSIPATFSPAFFLCCYCKSKSSSCGIHLC
jgi:hypothetical protein